MQGRRVEIAHNTDEQVRDYVARALALVEDLDPPSDLRGIVTAKAIDLYAAKQIMMEQIQPGLPLMRIPGEGLR